MQDDKTQRHLRLVEENEIGQLADPGRLADPAVQSDMAQFPSADILAAGITPELAQSFLSAAKEHVDAGDLATVTEQLSRYPDKRFAAVMGINLGLQSGNPDLIKQAEKLALEIEDEDVKTDIMQRAGAAALKLVLRKSENKSENDPVEESGLVKTDNTTVHETKESIPEQTNPEVNTADSVEQPSRYDLTQDYVTELKDLEEAIKEAPEGRDKIEATEAYDNQAVSIIKELLKINRGSLVDDIVNNMKTEEGKNKARQAYDGHMLTIIDDLSTQSRIADVQSLIDLMKTEEGKNKARQIYDDKAISLIELMISNGEYSNIDVILSTIMTSDGTARALEAYENGTLQLIKKLLEDGDTQSARRYSSLLRTKDGKSQANELLKSA